jgi:eukaryotic-like serine/threonine-protein kinase
LSRDRFGIVGKVVARTYHVEEFVAEGGFGVVYKAHHKGFRATVALKCLKIPDALGPAEHATFLEQFRAEAEVMFRLSAQIPAIVRPLHVDAFHLPDKRLVPFMALEWLEGRTLDAIIARRQEKGRAGLELGKLVTLLTPVAAALEQAHHFPGPKGLMTVVHRDMKPENLFVARVGGQDTAKVLDFGISKVKSAAGQLAGRLSQTGTDFVAFSPAYAAPEQWAPRTFGQTGKWTDVWGLALTVVEVAKGSEVVLGEMAAMMGIILDPKSRPTPRSQGVSVSDEVEAIFSRALALDPRDRTQTVGEFWDALTAALGIQQSTGRVSIKDPANQPKRAVTAGFESIAPPEREAAAVAAKPPAPAPLAQPAPPARVPASPPTQLAAQAPARAPMPSAPLGAARPPMPSAPLGAARPPMPSAPLGAAPLGSPALARTPAGRPYVRSRASTWKQLSPGLSLAVLSLALTALDRAYIATQGTALSLGPIRASWIAAGIMVLAIVSAGGALLRMSAE